MNAVLKFESDDNEKRDIKLKNVLLYTKIKYVVIITEKTLKTCKRILNNNRPFKCIFNSNRMSSIYIGFTGIKCYYGISSGACLTFGESHQWIYLECGGSAFVSVVLMNFLLTEPKIYFYIIYDTGYPSHVLLCLSASMLTGTLASKPKTCSYVRTVSAIGKRHYS